MPRPVTDTQAHLSSSASACEGRRRRRIGGQWLGERWLVRCWLSTDADYDGSLIYSQGRDLSRLIFLTIITSEKSLKQYREQDSVIEIRHKNDLITSALKAAHQEKKV